MNYKILQRGQPPHQGLNMWDSPNLGLRTEEEFDTRWNGIELFLKKSSPFLKLSSLYLIGNIIVPHILQFLFLILCNNMADVFTRLKNDPYSKNMSVQPQFEYTEVSQHFK